MCAGGLRCVSVGGLRCVRGLVCAGAGALLCVRRLVCVRGLASDPGESGKPLGFRPLGMREGLRHSRKFAL